MCAYRDIMNITILLFYGLFLHMNISLLSFAEVIAFVKVLL